MLKQYFDIERFNFNYNIYEDTYTLNTNFPAFSPYLMLQKQLQLENDMLNNIDDRQERFDMYTYRFEQDNIQFYDNYIIPKLPIENEKTVSYSIVQVNSLKQLVMDNSDANLLFIKFKDTKKRKIIVNGEEVYEVNSKIFMYYEKTGIDMTLYISENDSLVYDFETIRVFNIAQLTTSSALVKHNQPNDFKYIKLIFDEGITSTHSLYKYKIKTDIMSKYYNAGLEKKIQINDYVIGNYTDNVLYYLYQNTNLDCIFNKYYYDDYYKQYYSYIIVDNNFDFEPYNIYQAYPLMEVVARDNADITIKTIYKIYVENQADLQTLIDEQDEVFQYFGYDEVIPTENIKDIDIYKAIKGKLQLASENVFTQNFATGIDTQLYTQKFFATSDYTESTVDQNHLVNADLTNVYVDNIIYINDDKFRIYYKAEQIIPNQMFVITQLEVEYTDKDTDDVVTETWHIKIPEVSITQQLDTNNNNYLSFNIQVPTNYMDKVKTNTLKVKQIQTYVLKTDNVMTLDENTTELNLGALKKPINKLILMSDINADISITLELNGNVYNFTNVIDFSQLNDFIDLQQEIKIKVNIQDLEGAKIFYQVEPAYKFAVGREQEELETSNVKFLYKETDYSSNVIATNNALSYENMVTTDVELSTINTNNFLNNTLQKSDKLYFDNFSASFKDLNQYQQQKIHFDFNLSDFNIVDKKEYTVDKQIVLKPIGKHYIKTNKISYNKFDYEDKVDTNYNIKMVKYPKSTHLLQIKYQAAIDQTTPLIIKDENGDNLIVFTINATKLNINAASLTDWVLDNTKPLELYIIYTGIDNDDIVVIWKNNGITKTVKLSGLLKPVDQIIDSTNLTVEKIYNLTQNKEDGQLSKDITPDNREIQIEHLLSKEGNYDFGYMGVLNTYLIQYLKY